ncbi:hypothetical protein [Falsihalocynthiibacter sp. CO-5D18]|uniref:hypothetical protein n=1 Tax=Falsihalocynthiibacter sp. CO-5D18 TaxID=3240872 RepID=UPI00350FDECA
MSKAPKLASKLTKKCAYLRREFNGLSMDAQKGVRGATEARQALQRKFNSDVIAAHSAVEDTRKKAADFDRAAVCLEHPSAPSIGRVSQLAKAGALLGIGKGHRLVLFKSVAEQARDSADRAEARLDRSADDLAATRLLAEILDELPKHGGDIKSPKLAEKRKQYQAHLAAHRKESK